MRRVIAVLILFSFIAFLAGEVTAAAPIDGPTGVPTSREVITPELQSALDSAQPGELFRVIVELKEQANLQAVAQTTGLRGERIDQDLIAEGVVRSLQTTADRSQAEVRRYLANQEILGEAQSIDHFWIFNGFGVNASPTTIYDLAKRPEVAKIRQEVEIALLAHETAQVAPVEPTSNMENLTLTRIPELWAKGITGRGVVVMNLDSGVDGYHPGLSAQYRGGTNSWLAPIRDEQRLHPYPVDSSVGNTGHGTATMGIMVGLELNASGPGAAPDAQWAAVKIFSDTNPGNVTTETAIHYSFQWAIQTAKVDVINNSWFTQTTLECNTSFQIDLQNLRIAGILPIFAAGNTGTADTSPANLPEAFAVGSTNKFGAHSNFSSQGPSSCDGSVFPAVSAPGENIYTTNPQGGPTLYSTSCVGGNACSGTSFAAPQVAGGLALLLSAFPDLTVDEQEAALIASARDYGAVGPDNEYGYGLVDFKAAYEWLYVRHIQQFWLFLPFSNN